MADTIQPLSARTVTRRKVVYVPIITERQLRRIERAAEAVDRMMDLSEELGASLRVLTGDNEPEGWTKVRVRKDAVRQKAKKRL